MARKARFLLVLAGLLAWVSIAFADMSEARKLPSDTFKRFMVNGTDFKDALSACNFARQGTGWKAVSFDPPNPGGGVNCKYKKAGSSPGEQVAATLVLRCPENATPWISGTSDVNQQVCACVDGFVASGLACIPRERSKDRICDDATYDKLQDNYDQLCKKNGGMSCSEKGLGNKKYGALTCDTAKENLAKQNACLASRNVFQEKCFAAIDPRHQKVLDEHGNGVKSCEEAVQKKCSSSSSK